ncbi:MAG TPA: 2-dehydropantoate 2-reductase [Rubrivivax sp.]|nr:2-dehydropantoate 2-reductase [Rubrivivax sp.]
MKIAVVGAGAIGGYLGARLARAGQQVTFIARNRNLQTINEHGFRLVLADGQEEHVPAGPTLHAVPDGAEAGEQDYVLLAVKAHQLAGLLPNLRGLLGPQTAVASMINGVPWWYFHRLAGPHEGRTLQSLDPEGLIARHIEPERVIGGVVYPACELLAPGVVRVVEGQRFSLGEPDGHRSERAEILSQALMAAGFKSPISRDIRAEIWVKLWGNLAFNPISALSHATLQDICRYPPTRDLARRMMTEAKAVAEALGVVFKISLEQRLAGAEAVGAHKTSMLQDVEQGRALELQALVGAVVELGQITGVPTPTIEALHAVTGLLAHTLQTQAARLQVQPL